MTKRHVRRAPVAGCECTASGARFDDDASIGSVQFRLIQESRSSLSKRSRCPTFTNLIRRPATSRRTYRGVTPRRSATSSTPTRPSLLVGFTSPSVESKFWDLYPLVASPVRYVALEIGRFGRLPSVPPRRWRELSDLAMRGFFALVTRLSSTDRSPRRYRGRVDFNRRLLRCCHRGIRPSAAGRDEWVTMENVDCLSNDRRGAGGLADHRCSASGGQRSPGGVTR